MPSISAVGNISPVSTTTIRSSYSTTVMFFPISPRPPSGRTFKAPLKAAPPRLPDGSPWTRSKQPGGLERRADESALVLCRRDHRQPQRIALEHAEHLQRRLDRDRVGRDHGRLVDRLQLGVDPPHPVEVALEARIPHLPHLRADEV